MVDYIYNVGYVDLYFPGPHYEIQETPYPWRSKFQASGSPDVEVQDPAMGEWTADGDLYMGECFKLDPTSIIAYLKPYDYLGTYQKVNNGTGGPDCLTFDDSSSVECDTSSGTGPGGDGGIDTDGDGESDLFLDQGMCDDLGLPPGDYDVYVDGQFYGILTCQ